jgi:uncharacterized delta-60 repeat protein
MPTFAGKAIALGPSDAIGAVGEVPGNFGSSTGVGFIASAFTADGRPSAGWVGVDAGGGLSVTTPASAFGATSAGAWSAVVQGDGKMVALGYADVKLALARYTATGALDPAFGAGGIVTTNVGANSWIQGSFRIVVQADGSLVAAAVREQYGVSDVADLVLARYGAGGQLDCSFASGGIAIVPLGPIEYVMNWGALWAPFPVGLALGADGRIYVGATTGDGIKENVLVLRFTTGGFIDATSVVGLGPGLDLGHSLAVQGDGKVLVAGRTWNQAGLEDFYVARFAPPP